MDNVSDTSNFSINDNENIECIDCKQEKSKSDCINIPPTNLGEEMYILQ